MTIPTRYPSDLERAFETLFRQLGGPEPEVREHPFAAGHGRRFRFDFAWPSALVAVEVEGGVWSGGRHVRGAGFERDAEKYNLAAALGWVVFRVTRRMLEDPVTHLAPIIAAIQARAAVATGGTRAA